MEREATGTQNKGQGLFFERDFHSQKENKENQNPNFVLFPPYDILPKKSMQIPIGQAQL
jgi:hypothetical protein